MIRNKRPVLFFFFCIFILNSVCETAFADFTNAISSNPSNKTNFHISALFLQPGSTNLKYAVFVAGNQPYQQSWHNEEITPGYSPSFELGLNYALPQSPYDLSINWLNFNADDSDYKQASQNTDIATVEFVAPPYDVGPAVFGIKRANSSVNFTFNSVQLNVGKVFAYCPNVQMGLFGGINFLQIKQNIKTTFTDYVGTPPIPTQAYGLPPDPNFYFTTKNSSNYVGIGPALGINARYEINNGFKISGQFLAAVTAGSIRAKDNFTSYSTRLRELGLNPSRQFISTPDTTQVVPGFDSKLAVSYSHAFRNTCEMTIEAGYRFVYYENAISTVIPQTLVQAGENATIPEFSTGTMAIQSTDYKHSPFSLQGPYLDLVVDMA